MSLVYLKPNAIAEPLFNQWYAWSYLTPPASAALYVARSHLKILESFIEAPQVHQEALKDLAMRGAPFVNYGSDRLLEIQTLLNQTRAQQANLLKLAEAIQTLGELLQKEATGYSLEPLYAEVPEALRGYVELVYDTYHRPSIRVMEGLLYQSQYYDRAAQSIALFLSDEDARSFVLSTPRLKDKNSIHLQIPFDDSRWNQLFQMRSIPSNYSQIKEGLKVSPVDESLFASLFTETPPKPASRYSGEAVRIRYCGHACVLLETANVSVLCDPLISYQSRSNMLRYTYADLPEAIDYALITHNHQDHVMFETLLQLRHKIRTVIVPKSNKGSIIDPSLKLILQAIGFTDVREIDELETLQIADGYITSWPVLGEHGDLNIGAKTAYFIHLKGKSILCAADSNNLEPQLYAHLRDRFDKLDALFIGMECDGAPYTWAYNALLPQSISKKIAQTRRLDGSNFDRAAQLIQQLQPQQVYVYAMGQEPWLTYITSIQYTEDSRPILESNQLVEYCRQHQIYSERLYGCKEILLDDSAGAIALEQPSIQSWLAELAQQDVKFSLEESRLKCNAPKGRLTPTLQAKLKTRKAEIIQFLTRSTAKTNLEAEAILDPAIQPSTPPSFSPPNHIFVTGVTGFLGAFLLYELLEQTQAKIYCLVRAPNQQTASQKLRDRLNSYIIWQDSFSDRIEAIAGDLCQPLLGLTEAKFQEFSDRIDIIYHNGAWVHHTSPYSLLKPTNVNGTKEVIRLACQSKTKPLHFISSISVFAADQTARSQIVYEQDPLNPDRVPSGGYAQSKWVAERLVTVARDRGLPVSIYRPGAISGHSQTGVFNANDFLYKLIQGCIQLGVVPQAEMQLNLLPVDFVSRSIVHLSQQSTAIGKVFHLIHPQPVQSTLLFDFLRLQNYPIQQVSYDQWRIFLIEIASQSPDHPLYSIVPLFSTSHVRSQAESAVSLEFDCRNTMAELVNSSVLYPAIDAKLFNTYLSYLIQNKFITSSYQQVG